MITLGKHIKFLRKKRNLSQAQLGKRSGIKREYISYLEREKLKNPTLSTLNKIACGLEVPLENLLFFDSSGSHSLQDLLHKSVEMEQQIGHLKETLKRLYQLLAAVEKRVQSPGEDAPLPLLADEPGEKLSVSIASEIKFLAG